MSNCQLLNETEMSLSRLDKNLQTTRKVRRERAMNLIYGLSRDMLVLLTRLILGALTMYIGLCSVVVLLLWHQFPKIDVPSHLNCYFRKVLV